MIQVDQLYAADGGIETGIETLRTDQADGTANTCETIGETESLPCDDHQRQAGDGQCKTTKGGTTTGLANGGGTALLNGYSAILGTGGLTVGGNTPNGAPMVAFSLGGQVYSGGAITTVARAPVQIGGNLGYYAACPPLPPNVTLTAPGVCSQVAAPTVPTTSVFVPTTAAPAPVALNSSCTIFYPGKYSSSPAFSSSRNYMASGTYYFENTGGITFQGVTFGGAPGVGDEADHRLRARARPTPTPTP